MYSSDIVTYTKYIVFIPCSDLRCDLRNLDFGNDGDDTSNLLYPFMQSKDDEEDWEFNSIKPSMLETGPENDHTTGDGTGNFIYLEASGKKIGNRVRASHSLCKICMELKSSY